MIGVQRSTDMTQALLTIWNKHSQLCGEAPAVTNHAGEHYYGYFENRFGEQWVFVYDHERKIAELRGGEIGWDQIVTVHDGQVDLILGKAEAAWLQACWKAAT